MQSTGAGNVTATSYSADSTNQQYTIDLTSWFCTTASKIRDLIAALWSDRSVQHTRSTAAVNNAAAHINIPPLRIMYLLVCMHRTQGDRRLEQDRIETIGNDKELFYFMQQQLKRLRTSLWAYLRIRTVLAIHFTNVSSTLQRVVTMWKFNNHPVSSAPEQQDRDSSPPRLL